MDQAVTEINLKQFLRIFKDNKAAKSDSRFCFILGAGASVSSGIKSGATLSKEWIKDIKEDLALDDFKQWLDDSGVEENSPALHYPKIYQKRFQHNKKSGHEALMHVMTDKEPSVGYPFFAQVLVNTNHNIVITTNFDSLLESSIYRYTNSQPLVIGHENLANFLNSSTKRPIIAKIHRDLLLDPKNDTEGTSSLPKEWVNPLKQILETSHVVVVGYGGNDGSLMDFLQVLDNRNGIYWCKRAQDCEELSIKVKELLTKDGDRVVSIPDFDGLMIELADIFDQTDLIKKDKVEDSKIVCEANRRAQDFQQQIDDYAESKKLLGGISTSLKGLVSDWYEYQFKVDAASSIEEKDKIYQEGILITKHASLIGNYALFLHDIKKDLEAAEKYYLQALALAPDNGNVLGNYAMFLHQVKKDHDAAEESYLQALALAPDDANDHGNYATFLHQVKKDHDAAEEHYLQALALAPDNANVHVNYAGFLFGQQRNELANVQLKLSRESYHSADTQAILLECYFYEYAHLADQREEAEKQMVSLLDQGIRSPSFDLSQNIETAIKAKHPNPDKLQSYAMRISEL